MLKLDGLEQNGKFISQNMHLPVADSFCAFGEMENPENDGIDLDVSDKA